MANWIYSTQGSQSENSNIGYGDLAVAPSGLIVAPQNGTATSVSSSDNGHTWQNIPALTNAAGASTGWCAFAVYFNNQFVVFPSNNPQGQYPTFAFYTSPDGVTWTPHTFNVTTVFGPAVVFPDAYGPIRLKVVNGVLYCIQLIYVSAFRNLYVGQSTDGVTWTNAITGGALLTGTDASMTNADMDFGAGQYVIRINSTAPTPTPTYVGASLNSLAVNSFLPNASTFSYNGICFAAGKFVTIDTHTTNVCAIWTSPDGNTWTSHTPPGSPTSLLSIQFVNGLFWLTLQTASSNQQLYSSLDALTWTQETIPSPPAPNTAPTNIIQIPTGALVADGINPFGGDIVAYLYTPPPATIPNVVGDTVSVAVAVVNAAAFPVQVVVTASATVASGIVISQSPGAGVAPQSTVVTLTVSSGRAQVAGNGGDRWGAQGGGITPVGVLAPVEQTLSYAQRQANYLVSGTTNTRSVESDMSRGTLSGNFPDALLPTGGSNAG